MVQILGAHGSVSIDYIRYTDTHTHTPTRTADHGNVEWQHGARRLDEQTGKASKLMSLLHACTWGISVPFGARSPVSAADGVIHHWHWGVWTRQFAPNPAGR